MVKCHVKAGLNDPHKHGKTDRHTDKPVPVHCVRSDYGSTSGTYTVPPDLHLILCFLSTKPLSFISLGLLKQSFCGPFSQNAGHKLPSAATPRLPPCCSSALVRGFTWQSLSTALPHFWPELSSACIQLKPVLIWKFIETRLRSRQTSFCLSFFIFSLTSPFIFFQIGLSSLCSPNHFHCFHPFWTFLHVFNLDSYISSQKQRCWYKNSPQWFKLARLPRDKLIFVDSTAVQRERKSSSSVIIIIVVIITVGTRTLISRCHIQNVAVRLPICSSFGCFSDGTSRVKRQVASPMARMKKCWTDAQLSVLSVCLCVWWVWRSVSGSDSDLKQDRVCSVHLNI